MNTEEKIIGKYVILKLISYEVGGYDTKLNWKIGAFQSGEVSVHLVGKEKGLIKRQDYNTEMETNNRYNKLNTIKSVEDWIKLK